MSISLKDVITLVLAIMLSPGVSFHIPASKNNVRQVWDGQIRRDVTLHEPNGRCVTSRRSKSNDKDDDQSDEDQINYSADPLTAFLGKFLPKEQNEATPRAEDLVREDNEWAYCSIIMWQECFFAHVPSSFPGTSQCWC